jgi:hypothetical protein
VYIVQIAQRILKGLQRLYHSFGAAGRGRCLLHDVAEMFRRNARAMRHLDVVDGVDGGEMAPHVLALFCQPPGERGSESGGATGREYSGTINAQPLLEFCGHRGEVGARGERLIAARVPLGLEALDQPGETNAMPRAQLRPHLA